MNQKDKERMFYEFRDNLESYGIFVVISDRPFYLVLVLKHTEFTYYISTGGHYWSIEGSPVTFQYVFDRVHPNTQLDLLFHLDVFRAC